MKVVIAGVGAFGQKHLDACKLIDGVEVVSVVGRQLAPTEEIARKYGVPHATTHLAEALGRPGVEAAILCTPTQLHAAQAMQCLNVGVHVQVEIPLADNFTDAQVVAALAGRSDLVCMVGHTRRFNPSHQWVHRRIVAGELAKVAPDLKPHIRQ
jgi:2-hydroxy-4-carboxymuconate semialdehyde hemiacetal dehydrogenase